MWIVPFKINEHKNVEMQGIQLDEINVKEIRQITGNLKPFQLWEFYTKDGQTYLKIIYTDNNTIVIEDVEQLKNDELVKEDKETLKQFIEQINSTLINISEIDALRPQITEITTVKEMIESIKETK